MRKIANALMSIALLISLVQTAIIPVMATNVNEEEYRVLFVGGDGAGNDVTPGSSDDQTMQHLKELGFTVEFSQAAVTKGPDAAGYDLMFIAETASSGDIENKFKDVRIPMVISEAWALVPGRADLVVADGGGNVAEQTSIDIVNADHPLAAGLSEGLVRVYEDTALTDPALHKEKENDNGKVNYGIPAEDATIIATVEGDEEKATIFAFEAGDKDIQGHDIPARRVVTYLFANHEDHVTAEGWALIDAAVYWALGIEQQDDEGSDHGSSDGDTGDLTIPEGTTTLYLGNDGEGHEVEAGSADDKTIKHLETLGLKVDFKFSKDANAPDTDGYDLLFIGESVGSGDIGDKYNAIEIPIVTAEAWALRPEMGALVVKDGFGNVAYQTSIDIVKADHPLAAGLPAGLVQVYDEMVLEDPALNHPDPDEEDDNGKVNYGIPADDAIIIATVEGDAEKASIFAFEAGSKDIHADTIPARRVVTYLFANHEDYVTEEGWALIDAAVYWALGIEQGDGESETEPVEPVEPIEYGPVDSYIIKRGETQGGPYTAIAEIETEQYVDEEVEVGNTYYYVITAKNRAGESNPSAEVSIELADPTSPGDGDGDKDKDLPPPTVGMKPSPTPSVPSEPEQTRDGSLSIDGTDESIKVKIVREEKDEATRDRVVIDEDLMADIVDKALEMEHLAVTLSITTDSDNPVDEYFITLELAALSLLSEHQIELKLDTEFASLNLSAESITAAVEEEADVTFRIVPILEDEAVENVINRVQDTTELFAAVQDGSVAFIGSPVMVESDLNGIRTKVALPFKASSLAGQADEMLHVFVEHSDGENIVHQGTVLYDDEDQPVGIEIEVTKFSTFTILTIEQPEPKPDPEPVVKRYDSYINGYPEDGTFRPSKTLSRAELAAIIAQNIHRQEVMFESKWIMSEAEHNILYVGKGRTSDDQLMDYLKSKGYGVDLIVDTDVTTNDTAGYDLVFIGESSDSANIGSKFKSISIPVIHAEPFALTPERDPLSSDDLGSKEGQTSIDIVTGDHPLAAGLPQGIVAVYDESSMASDTKQAFLENKGKINYGTPSDEAIVIATLDGDDRAAIFAYEAGAKDIKGNEVPARRVASFLFEYHEDHLTDEGWALLDAMVDWALDQADGTKSPPKQVEDKPIEPTSPVPVSSGNFTDVPATHWANAYIEQLHKAGIMSGSSKDQFKPNDPVTRAEFAVVLARWLQLPTSGQTNFADVENHWAKQGISALEVQGWMSGYEDGTFRPNQELTRAEAVKTLHAAMKRPSLTNVTESSWPDVSSDHWAKVEIESASKSYSVTTNPDGSVEIKLH